MANFVIPDFPEFNTEMEMFKTTDRAHADLFNKVFAQLLENDACIAEQTKAVAINSIDGNKYILKRDDEGVYLELYEYTVFKEASASFTGSQMAVSGFMEKGFVEGYRYIVSWNGVDYKTECYKGNDGDLCVGNGNLCGYSDKTTEHPFLIVSYGGTSSFVYKSTSTKETIKLKVVGINTKVDTVTKSDVADSLRLMSKEQVNALFGNKITAIAELSASKWSSSYPYTQTVTVVGVTADMDVKVIGVYVPDNALADEVKSWNKAAGYLMSHDNATQTGKVIFYAYKKPTTDFSVIIEGG